MRCPRAASSRQGGEGNGGDLGAWSAGELVGWLGEKRGEEGGKGGGEERSEVVECPRGERGRE